MTYIIGGAFLGISSILMVSNMGTINPKINMASMSQVFTPMMGVMIGLFLRSCNTVIGVFIGELSITIVSTGLVAIGLESRLQNVIVGIFLLIFMSIQINAKRITFHKRGSASATA
jgi:ribose transport system permease protein